MDKIEWMRMFGDTTFAGGAMLLGWFVINLFVGRSQAKGRSVESWEHTLTTG